MRREIHIEAAAIIWPTKLDCMNFLNMDFYFIQVPLLPGDNDLDQLSKIFQALGTPSEQDWPVRLAFLKQELSISTRYVIVNLDKQRFLSIGHMDVYCNVMVSAAIYITVHNDSYVRQSGLINNYKSGIVGVNCTIDNIVKC